MTSLNRNLELHMHPYSSGVFIPQYVSVSEPKCTVDRRFIQAPQYQCKTDYDPSVFIIFTFSSLYLHAPSLLTHRYLVTHYCYYSKPIMFPVLFYCQFWLEDLFDLQQTFITAASTVGKCQGETRNRRAAASPYLHVDEREFPNHKCHFSSLIRS